MVLGVKPVRLEVKVPVVPAAVTLLLEVVGTVGDMEYTTPRSVTAQPPSPVTLPPVVAVVQPIEVAAVVAATVGDVQGSV